MDSSSDDDRVEGPLPVIPYCIVGGRPLLRYSPARWGRSCPCRAKYSYPNRLVLGVAEERRHLTRDFRIALEEREEMEATIEAQAARIQELEARETGNYVDGIMAECVTMIERLEEALLGNIPGEAAPAVEVEVEPIEEDPKENPSKAVGSSTLEVKGLFHIIVSSEQTIAAITIYQLQNLSSLQELCQVLAKTRKSMCYTLIDRLIRLILTLPVSTATTEREVKGLFHIIVSSEQTIAAITIYQELSQVLEKTRKSMCYTLIDRLIRLIFTLPVSTVTTERVFSAMKIIKICLRSRMEEDFLTNSMIMYIEKEIARTFDINSIIEDFDKIKSHRAQFYMSHTGVERRGATTTLQL
nr:uncharacterized protein LOC113689259 [Coffea arabica]